MSVPTVGDPTGDAGVDGTTPADPGHPGSAFGALQAAYAATLVDEWVRGGVRLAVVCPGSRSTPLAVACAGHPGLEVHVRLDERSAGFVALGAALASGRPVVIVVTSGTAAAELHPAVVEADLSAVPLVVCTADRPPELLGVGAPQTITQHGLYGTSVRFAADPGPADAVTRPTWRSLAARALSEATNGPGGPGPVHLNLAFRDPLVVAGPVAAEPGRPDGAPWHRLDSGPGAPPQDVVELVAGAGERGLVVAGAGCGPPRDVVAMAGTLGWPVLADPRSGLRDGGPGVVTAAEAILRTGTFAAVRRPDTVLRLGASWASRVVGDWLDRAARDGATTVAVDEWGRWRDPGRVVTRLVRGDPALFCRAVTATGPARATSGGWRRAWEAAERAARSAADGVLAGEEAAGRICEPSLARRLFSGLPPGATLVVASSMPIRDLEAFAVPRAAPPRVLANRGANGIDGVVSTAIGVSLGGPGPVVALVGDLAFLHDASALVGTGGAAPSCTVVVADNGGGGIFSFLPQAGILDGATFETLFGTAQAPDVAAVAAGFGLEVDDVADGTAFDDALVRHLGLPGLSVIRVRVPGREENVGLHARLHAAVADAVAGAVDGTRLD